MSIGARSQSAKTYLEKHYESFPDGALHLFLSFEDEFIFALPASIEELIKHGLHALRETLQQDKELNVNNTSIGILGPLSQFESKPVVGGAFRILENSAVEPFLKTMVPKDTAPAGTTTAAATTPAQGRSDADVQMSG